VERPDVATLERALDRFRGTFAQVPPSVSAKRIGGRRAYELARADKPVDLAPVPVHVRHLELVSTDAETAMLKVACSSGFYVRSLAHDLGQALGIGAHLTALRRTRSGRFGLPGSVTVEALASAPAEALERVIPLADLLPDVPAVTLQPEGRERTLNGREVLVEHLAEGALPTAGFVRLLDGSGTLLAMAERRSGALHPVVVLM
jgi:tRNA pseudouridine55 synthase